MAVVLNLKQKNQDENTLIIHADKDVLYNPAFLNIPNLDTAYTLILDEGLDSEVTYTVGSGLTLVQDPKSIVWALDTHDLEAKRYEGYLTSASDVSGLYLYIKIILTVAP